MLFINVCELIINVQDFVKVKTKEYQSNYVNILIMKIDGKSLPNYLHNEFNSLKRDNTS